MEEVTTAATAATAFGTTNEASSSSRLHVFETTLNHPDNNNNNNDQLDGSRRRPRRCSRNPRDDDHSDGAASDDSTSSTTTSSIPGGGDGNGGGLARHLTFWDLLAIGVCGSIGSGIFVLVGLICHEHAGRASPLSWLLAGIAAATSSLCFAELASHIPHSGSTYIYTCICWGQQVAVVSAACLTLEYGIAGAAVARTWGDKLIVYLVEVVWHDNTDAATTIRAWLLPFKGAIHVPAAVASAASTWLLLVGVKESKQVTNVFTLLKMALVSFMIIGGLTLYRSPTAAAAARGGGSVPIPFAPYGAAGVLRGATSSFFGFIGYDEVCVVAGEALHPSRDLPRAVLGTVLIVTIVSVLAAFALSNMGIPYTDISSASGFPQAFSTRGVEWAAHLTSIGELVSLPIVVLVSLMAQPRLTLAMAQDGILPASIFGTRHGQHQHHVTTTNGDCCHGINEANLQQPPSLSSIISPPGPAIPDPLLISPDDFNNEHNLTGGTMFAGVAMTIIASLVPFSYLDDLISSGILVAFSMANSCLILLRCEPRRHNNSNYATSSLADIQQIKLKCDGYVLVYNFISFVTSILWTHSWDWPWQTFWATLSLLAWLASLLLIVYEYPASNHFGRYLLPEYRRVRHRRQGEGHHQQLNHSGDSNGSEDGNNYNTMDAMDSNMTTSTVNDAKFRAPCVPFVPCCGIAINWYLVAQLEFFGLLLLALYLGMTLVCYHLCCSGNGNIHLSMTIVPFIRRMFFSCFWWRHEQPYEAVAASRASPSSSSGTNANGDDGGAVSLVPVHSFA
jgi:amino acid transporter